MQLRKIPLAEVPDIQDATYLKCALYVVAETSGEHVKVGIANHPKRRLSSLQCGNPRRISIIAVYEGGRETCRAIERTTHRFFMASPGTEWFFAPDPQKVVRYLDSFCDGGAL